MLGVEKELNKYKNAYDSVINKVSETSKGKMKLVKKYFKKRSILLIIIFLLPFLAGHTFLCILFAVPLVLAIWRPSASCVDNYVSEISADAKRRAMEAFGLEEAQVSKREPVILAGYDTGDAKSIKVEKKTGIIRTNIYEESVLLFAEDRIYCIRTFFDILENKSQIDKYDILYSEITETTVVSNKIMDNGQPYPNDGAEHALAIKNRQGNVYLSVIRPDTVREVISDIRIYVREATRM